MAKSTKNQLVKTSTSGKHLVIVESPAKARTVERFLGPDYIVRASMGHVRDLPEGKLGVEVERDFAPNYVVIKGKKTIIGDLKKAGQQADSVYLATDPDREGEAISWHLREAAGWKNVPIRRVVFHEITPEAIKQAFEHHRDIDMGLVNAQQARRILDRLVGYQLSPLLWRKVQRGLSAGRVQSVALRIVVERDRAIEGFKPEEYWSLEATLAPENGTSFIAALHHLAGEQKRIELKEQQTTTKIQKDLEQASFEVDKITKREMKRRPAAPFITSTLQQEAWRQLKFSARKTMSLAQQLYEGMSVGEEGSVGLITYMRTDSPQVANTALEETRLYIEKRYGSQYGSPTVRRHASRSKVAQEAHEAIRPTSIERDPTRVMRHLGRDHLRLYELIWKRMVASQMADALLDSTQIEITANGHSGQNYVFRAGGSIMRFAGFRTLYIEAEDEQQAAKTDDDLVEQEQGLPGVKQGQSLACHSLDPIQHFTEPPPRYTEASLIKKLEERGIGRPSTYAPIISTLVDRHYTTREKGSLHSTRLGQVVNDQLLGHFPDIMDPDFTAQLEERLDDVASGKDEWVPLLSDFYQPFHEALEKAREEMPRVRVEEPTDDICEKCGKPMVIKHGRFGQFLSCSGFPECKNSRPLLQKTGVHCPRCDTGELVQRRGKTRAFYGCTNYPECDFTVSQYPLAEPCPECNGLLVSYGRENARCTVCAYRGQAPEQEVVESA